VCTGFSQKALSPAGRDDKKRESAFIMAGIGTEELQALVGECLPIVSSAADIRCRAAYAAVIVKKFTPFIHLLIVY
jgi:hypothetical protein